MKNFTLYYTTEETASEPFIRRAVADHLGQDLRFAEIRRDPLGKPHFTDPALPCFSLSHSGMYTVCAVGPSPCGVDVQIHLFRGKKQESDYLLRLADRFFHPEEATHLRQCPVNEITETFFRIWTAKESYVKYTGRGLRDFSLFSVYAPNPKVITQTIPFGEGVSLCFTAERDASYKIKRI